MKKLISLLMTVLLISSMLSVGALADTVPAVAYVTDSVGTVLTDGDTITTVEGQLSVVFDSVVADDVLDGISITATVGSFKGAASAEIDEEDTAKVNVRFGRLEDGAEYVLSVPAASFEFSFRSEIRYLTNADFSDSTKYPLYNAEEGIQDDITEEDNLGYLDGWDGESKEYARILENTSGVRYLSISPSYSNGGKNKAYGLVVCADSSMGGNFNTAANVSQDKVFVIDSCIAFSLGGEASTTSAVGILAGDTAAVSAKTSVLGPTNNWQSVYTKYNPDLNVTKYSYSLEDGWVKPRLVLRRGDGNVLLQDTYDMANDGVYVGTGNGYSTALSKKVSRIGILTEYVQTVSSLKEFRYAYVRAYPERLLTVIKTGSYVGGEEKKLVVHMSDEFDESSVTSDSFTVTRADGMMIDNIEIEADSFERTITLTFPGGLRRGTYTLETKGMKGSNGFAGYPGTVSFEVDKANGIEYYETVNYTVTDAEDNPVLENNFAGKAKVTVDVISDEGNAFTMALVIYDKNNRVIRIATDSGIIEEGEESGTLTVSTPDDINIGEGYTVRPLVWLDDTEAGAIFVEEFEKLTALSAQ